MIFMNYLKHHNGTLEDYLQNVHVDRPLLKISDVLKLFTMKQIQISIHSYSLFDRSIFGGSYPIFNVDWCVMIPIGKEISRHLYVIRPLDWRLWTLLLFSVIYISFVLNTFDRILQDNRRLQHGRFGEAISSSIAFLAHIPLTYRMASAHWKRIIGVYIPLMVLGFIISNLYTTLLASFMTTTFFEDDLTTISDLISAGIPMMIKKHDATRTLQIFKIEKDIQSLMKVVGSEEFNDHCNRFNQSFAYLMPSDKWNFLSRQQKHLYRPIFRFSKKCISKNLPVSFLMEYDSHLGKSLNNFILKVMASGLNQYWIERDFEELIKLGEMRRFYNSPTVEAITLKTLLVAWLLLACGYVLASIALAVEISFRPKQ